MKFLTRNRVGDGVRAVAMSVVFFFLLRVGPVEAKWLRAESPLFIIYSDGPEADLRKFTQDLQNYDALLQTFLGAASEHSPEKLAIYLVSNEAYVHRIDPRLNPHVAGFYEVTPNAVFAVAVRNPIGDGATIQTQITGQDIIFHEYTHHFLMRYDKTNYPDWCQEGLAEYFSTARFKDDKVEIGQDNPLRARQLTLGQWYPMQFLFTGRDSRTRDYAFYPESWLVVHYIMDQPKGSNVLSRYLKGLQQGEPVPQAFQEAFGMNFEQLDKTLRDHIGDSKILLRVAPLPAEAKPVDIKVEELPSSADETLLMHVRLLGGFSRSKDDAASFTQDVRDASAKYPTDPLALLNLGMAEVLFGDVDKADAPLDQLLAANPDDAGALYWKAKRYYEAGRKQKDQRELLWAKAKSFAGKVYKLDPNNYSAIYLYGLLAGRDQEIPSENTINVFLLAHQLAPQVSEITVNTAITLLRANQVAPAKRMLQILVSAPHPGKNTEIAKDLLKKIDAGEISEAAKGVSSALER